VGLIVKYVAATSKDLLLATPPRSIYSSKRENGKVLIVGGSEDYHGAPALASTAAYSLLAALRVGIGYATAFVPRSVLNANRSVSPNIIVKPLSGNNLSLNDIPMLCKEIDRSNCLVLGPGLGRKPKTIKAVTKLLAYLDKKEKRVVVDADALYAVAKYTKKLSRNFILTPNAKEFLLFYKKKFDDRSLSSKISAAIEVSKTLNANILLKGHNTIVTDGRRTKIITAKTSALATMGTGDVLSGIIGAYAAKNKDMFVSAVAGAYLHALIGDALYKEKGNHILASDVVDLIPSILKKFDRD
jgi:hydroxyethylthiazole kinase-like uncharacterized protein yjeF